MAEQPLHPLHEKYLDALYDLPDELRVRRALEDDLARTLTGGKHVCVRGFWRMGKTTLMRGVLENAANRTGGAAFLVDLRNSNTDDGLVKTADEALAHVAEKVAELLKRSEAPAELKVDPKKPLEVLGELAAPLFVGVDELIALQGLPPAAAEGVIEALLTTPKNVKVVAVCHRHQGMNELFERVVVARPNVFTVDVPFVSDEELVHLVNTPALPLGVHFTDEALGAVAVLSGNRPWEAFTLCSLVASTLKPDFKGGITPEQVEAFYDLDALASTEEGQALVNNVLRILMTAFNPEEKALVDLLVSGNEGEASEDAVARLSAAGLLVDDGGLAVNGALFEGLAGAVQRGEIKVSVG